jgi:hypothetical protein
VRLLEGLGKELTFEATAGLGLYFVLWGAGLTLVASLVVLFTRRQRIDASPS